MFDAGTSTAAFYLTCARGLERMDPESRIVLSETILSLQGPGGLFRGRADQEDLYYTFFGLLLAALCAAPVRWPDCESAVRSIKFDALDLVHRCAWLRATVLLRLIANHADINAGHDEEKLRSLLTLPRESYPQRDPDSPYSRFLIASTYADFGQIPPETKIDAYRLPDGLFANMKHHAGYATNATAAALFLLPEENRDETTDALRAVQEPNGSYKATAAAPTGDLLSTATAAFALQQYGKPPLRSLKPFLRDCFRENALFAATPDDSAGDLEYTTYGLLAMGVTE